MFDQLEKLTEWRIDRPYVVCKGSDRWRRPFSVWIDADNGPEEVSATVREGDARLLCKLLNDHYMITHV